MRKFCVRSTTLPVRDRAHPKRYEQLEQGQQFRFGLAHHAIEQIAGYAIVRYRGHETQLLSLLKLLVPLGVRAIAHRESR